MLAALSAAVLTIIAFELYHVLQTRHQVAAGDPLRVIRGVVTAVGFLGGGAIIRGNGEVQGLTTAANIWLCGVVGLARRAGLYVLTSITFGFTVGVVTGMQMLDDFGGVIRRKGAPRSVTNEQRCGRLR